MKKVILILLVLGMLPWKKVEAVGESCQPIRYSFIAFTPANFGQGSTLQFGGVDYTYNDLPWMKDTSKEYVNIKRLAGHTIESTDCGNTWQRLNEYIPPIKLRGDPVNDFGDGTNHFVTNLGVDFFSQAFVSWSDWQNGASLISRIYPVFANGTRNKWSFQGLNNGTEPLPAVGSSAPDVKDNFYSPAILPVRDADKNIMLYFGGWRYRVEGEVSQCNVVGRAGSTFDLVNKNGYAEKTCSCREYQQNGEAVDMCTGDKIFVATNKFSGTNKLAYKVWKGNGNWTDNGWQSNLYEPVIWSALINNSCLVGDCPFKFLHTNDPTVIEVSGQSYKYLMYFTGGVFDPGVNRMVNYTHLVTSNDGINWNGFKILGKQEGLQFPGNLAYNSANGTVRAYFDETRNKIVLLSVPVPSDMDNPIIGREHPDAWKLFIYEIDPASPAVVRTIKKVDKINHQLAECVVGQTCAVAMAYGQASPKPGDATGDGLVNLADFVRWKREFTGALTTKTADFNNDSNVNLADFVVWKKSL